MASKKHIWLSLILIVIFVLLGFFVAREQKPEAKFPFRLGLDLKSGTELVYLANTSGVENVGDAMASLKEVIERRVNVFGVSEPFIQTERAGLVSGNDQERLIVGLPGVTDLAEAKALIGKTPILEFFFVEQDTATTQGRLVPSGLTGQYLSKARVEFNPTTQAAQVGVDFNDKGKELFAKITREHVGEELAIVLDGALLSAPVIQEEIKDGKAQITGSFTPEEARELVRNLNYGALPVPITFSTSQTVGASLGGSALNSGIYAGIVGFIVLSLFLIFWYRLPGLVAVVALTSYIVLSLTAFILIPVTFTAAGIAGFILSIGMAVDANVLIFERTKEELKAGKEVREAILEGFSRAWLSIRDSNISSIITAVVLFWLGSSAVKGFALTLGVGVLISMFTAITVSRTFLLAIAPKKHSAFKKFLFSNGLHFK
ncbi:MAG: protein translocase subunit SecD [Patescibacteria group bacterium]